MDTPADSARFAKDAGLPFRLLSDPGGEIGRVYTGFNDVDDTDVPGVVVVRADGTVAFRQIAASKDDRLTAPQVFDVLDRTLGTSGPAATRVTPLSRVQLRVDAGAGVGEHTSGELALSEAVLLPIGTHLLVGPWLAYTGGRADLDAAILLRAPILGDAGAISVGALVGDGDSAARAELWFAWTPSYAITLGTEYRVDTGHRDAVFTIGVGRLVWVPNQ